MRASLKKKGISTKGKKLKEVSELFYKTFLMKGKQVKTNFDAAYYEQNFAGGTENFAVASTVLVKTIIEFISQIAKKKKEGKPLTAAEKQIDDAITETKTTQTNQAVGEYMPYIVGGVVILIFATIILTRKK